MRALLLLAAALALLAGTGHGDGDDLDDGGISPPGIVLQPKAPAGVREDAQVSLRVVATGADDYTWSKDGEQLLDERGHISGANSFNLRIYGARLSDAGRYQCFISNLAGVTASLPTDLEVAERLSAPQEPQQKRGENEKKKAEVEPPKIALQPKAPPHPSAGGQVSLRVVATGAETYQWRKNGAAVRDEPGRVSGAASFNLRIRSAQLDDVGNYSCLVANAAGQVESAVVFLGIKDAEIVVTGEPSSQRVIVGNPVVLSVAATPVDTYQWHKGGVPLRDRGGLKGAQSPVLSLAAAAFTDDGLYYCEMRNRMHTRKSRSAQLKVTPDPRPPTLTAQPSSYSVRERSNVALSVQAERAVVFQWFKGGAPLADGGGYSGTGSRVLQVKGVTWRSSGSYHCEVSNDFGTTRSLSALVKVTGIGRDAGRRLCPPEEPLAKSDGANGCQKLAFKVHNHAQRPIVGFHIDPEGVSQQYFDLGSGSVSINTCVGHAWRVATPTGHVLLSWTMRDASPVVIDDCLRAEQVASYSLPYRFGSFFGGGSYELLAGQLFGVQQPKASGGQQVFDVNLDLKDALKQHELNVDVQRQVICPVCEGRGGAKHQVETCSHCKGSGKTVLQHELGSNGSVIQEVENVCPLCDGHGHVHKPGQTCHRCKGARLVPDKFKTKLVIPKGAPDMHTVTFAGQGSQGPFKTPMDVAFRVRYAPHETFTVQGADLHATVNITLAEALAGFNRTVPRLQPGQPPIEIERKVMTTPGFEQTFPGEGLPYMAGSPASAEGVRGSLVVEYNVVFPESVYNKDALRASRSSSSYSSSYDEDGDGEGYDDGFEFPW